jgi:cell division protein FtsZ
MEDILKFDFPLNQSSHIKVIGVGGGGNNAVNHMFELGIQGVDFFVCNTDAVALDNSPIPNKIQLGEGLGAGNDPEEARDVALEKEDEIKALFENNTKMVFITAGMGGGTGTGAAPVIAKFLKEIELTDKRAKNILTVAVVTTPFRAEGRRRVQQAQEGIAELRKHVDAILIINNDKLREYGEIEFDNAFAMADNVLATAVETISRIIMKHSKVQIDFRDVYTVMRDSGVALMGYGLAEGEERAIEAIKQAIESPLLNDNNIDGAKNVLLYISTSSEKGLTMSEFDEITQHIQKVTGHEEDTDMIWGKGKDESLGEKISVTLIATGFNEQHKRKKPIVVDLEKGQIPESSAPSLPQTPSQPVYNLDDEWDDRQMLQKPMASSQTAEPNSLGAAINFMEQQISTPPKTLIVNEIPNKDEPFLRFEKTDAPTVNAERFHTYTTPDRIQQLRELSAKVKTIEGIEELERVPAFVQKGIKLTEPAHSSTSEMARFNLTDDGRVIGNAFLHDNVD